MVVVFSMMVLSEAGLLRQVSQFYQMEWSYLAARKWLLTKAADHPPQLDRCLVRLQVNQRLQGQSMQWWQAYACQYRGANQIYYYVIESLGRDDCGVVSERDKDFVIHDYQVTVNLIDRSGQQSLMLLQHVYAVTAPRTMDCQSSYHLVKPGLQSEQILSMD
jgi:hypothetical protein